MANTLERYRQTIKGNMMELTTYQKIALGKTHEELSKDLRRYADAHSEYPPMQAILLEAAHRVERFASLE